MKAGGRYHWMTEAYPAEGVSLRSAAIDNFVIIEQGPKPRVIGEVDRPAAPLLIHEEAIYMHGGQQYHVDRLDWDEKKAYVRKVDVDYYTDANLAVDLEVLESFERAPAPGCDVDHGEVAVSDVATIFKKIKLDTHENVGWGKISMPEESRHTTGYWFALSDEQRRTGLARGELQDGLWGLAHLLRNLAPHLPDVRPARPAGGRARCGRHSPSGRRCSSTRTSPAASACRDAAVRDPRGR